MLKIQNFFNRTRKIFSKLYIPKLNSNRSSSRPPLTKLITLLPATCWFGIHLLSMEQLKIKNKNSIQSEIDGVILKSEKQDLRDLLTQIIDAMKDNNLLEAKAYINEGIQMSEQNKFNEYLPHLYDLLITVNMREGNLSQAEEILVRSIEKLTEVGYKEVDNEIVRFQLMLARLYQSNGDTEMAGIGFRNCISIQETKYKAGSEMDDTTTKLYLSILFWYSIFLTDENKLNESKNLMIKALELSKSTKALEPGQTVVILYNLAELSFRLKVKLMIFIYYIEMYVLVNRNTTMSSNI